MNTNCITEHNQARQTMTHTFKKGVRIIVNWRALTLTIERYRRTLDVFPITGEDYTINAHNELLREVERITRSWTIGLFGHTDHALKNVRNRLPVYISKN